MHPFLYNSAYFVGKLHLTSIILACLYILLYPLAIETDAATFFIYHIVCSIIILVSIMDACLVAYLFIKLAEKIYSINNDGEQNPPDCSKFNKWLAWSSLALLIITGIFCPFIIEGQSWAELLGSFSLLFAILGFIYCITLLVCNRWLRNQSLIIVGFHILSFFIQIAIHIALILLLIFGIALIV